MEKSTPKITPKDVSLHFFNIFTFYLSVIGFITLCIQYISAIFPDPLTYYFSSIAASVRTSSAILIIATPAYLLSAWILAKDQTLEPGKRDLALRKWLIFLTLFVAAVTIVIDLIVLVYNFLDGELNVQFFLKTFVVLLVAAAVFGYYIWELKRKDEKSGVPKFLGAATAVVVVFAIVVGFFIIGTPKDQRDRRFDDQRVNNLQSIQEQIISYWTRKNSLPESLSQIEDNIMGFSVPRDPATGLDYEYKIINPLNFELCADFASDSMTIKGQDEKSYQMRFGYSLQNWKHTAGRNCWTRTIDPELYKTEIPPVK